MDAKFDFILNKVILGFEKFSSFYVYVNNLLRHYSSKC